MNTTETITIPSELTEKTYFYNPGRLAVQRRNNEERKLSIVRSFFETLGLDTEEKDNSVIGTIKNDFGDCYFEYSYSESTKNVYKQFEIYVNGKKKNITFLKKMLDPIKKEKLK